jgi:hypothetical protein
MSIAGWQHRLDEASTHEAVVRIVDDFLALWRADEIAQLPPDCRPGVIGNAAEVNNYAMKLARRHTIGNGDATEMHRMAIFFTKAALRLFEIKDKIYLEMPRARRKNDDRADS